jgi:hypothetical protein
MNLFVLKDHKYLLLISGMLLALPALAADYQPTQYTITVDAVGQMFFHSVSLKPGPFNTYTGLGGQFFADYRPFQEVSFGLGADYISYSGLSLTVQTFELGGRIYPAGYSNTGEFFLQGGLGLNLNPFYYVPSNGYMGHYYGNAGLGYRFAINNGLSFDLGAQYDYYSPYAFNSNGVRLKAGLTFGFGPAPSRTLMMANASPSSGPSYTPTWKLEPRITWNANDTLGALAEKMYGDADLYPLIVDANTNLFREGNAFKPGATWVIPALPPDERALDAIRQKAMEERGYVHLEDLSEAASSGWGEDWKGPKHYTWKEGDNLPDVADKLYGDEDLYPLLVDANKDRLVHPANLRPGVVLIVPKPQVDQIDKIHEEVWFNKDPYVWWKTVSYRNNSAIQQNDDNQGIQDNP